MTSKADELPLETEPVASDNNMIFMLKHGDQTFVAPYSTDNRVVDGIRNTKTIELRRVFML